MLWFLQTRVERLRTEYEKARARAADLKAKEESLASELSAYERILAVELQREGQSAPQLSKPVQPALAADLRNTGNGHNKTVLAAAIIGATGMQGASVSDLDMGFRQHGINLQRNYLFNITSRLKSQGKIEQRGGRYYVKS